MSDFFKNNQIALRHCFLYEYLRKIPIDKCLIALQKTFGPVVIKKKKINFWFDQFKQGVFDIHKDKKPITDMRDVLRSDKNALRACILYESLKYKQAERGSSINSLWPNRNFEIYEYRSNPSFAMYKVFCKAVGKAVMKYQEFDFWFYRFFNGEFDLNFERDKDEKIYELMDMPVDVMENVVEYLDIFDRMKLAKTSRSLQTFVEDQKLFHHILELRIFDFVATVSLSNSVDIGYIRDTVGCKRIFKRRETLVRGEHYWKQALLGFKGILNNPKLHLDFLVIGLHVNNEHVLNDLEDALKFRHHLNVKNLITEEFSRDTLATILPTLKPEYLATINSGSHTSEKNSMKMVIEMEQWKQAKQFEMNGSHFIWPLRHLYHFVIFMVTLKELSVKDIRQMKETLFNSPKFEKCIIKVVGDTDVEAIEEEFGDYIQQEKNIPEYIKIYHYPILNSSEYFEIYVERSYIEITRMKR